MRRWCHKRPAPVRSHDRHALVDRFRDYESVVEIGVGEQTDVAAALVDNHVDVTATDIVVRSVPEGVTFVLDDVTDPDPGVYEHADLLYAINLPGELQRPMTDLASALGLPCAFTTFGTEGPTVAAEPEAIGGDTLYWVRPDPQTTG